MWLRSLGQEDPLEEETATHSSILAWTIPGMEEPGGYSPGDRKELDTTEVTEHTSNTSFKKGAEQKLPSCSEEGMNWKGPCQGVSWFP